MYSEFDIPRKLFAFHATAMYLIMRVFENGYFFGLPAELIGIRNAVLSVKGAFHFRQCPGLANTLYRSDSRVQ